MLGLSVYFKDLDLKYLDEVSRKGVKFIFTSLHIPEENQKDILKKIPPFLELCKQRKLEVIPDISPRTLEIFNVKQNNLNQLKEMGFNYLRLDYGFDDFETIKKIMKDFKVVLNASVVDELFLIEARKNGVLLEELMVMYNFYPHPNTGLDYDDFKEKNKIFKKYHLQVQVFVCGDELKRFPFYEGLPTLEKHRESNPYVAAVELLSQKEADYIFIGDSKAKVETLDHILVYIREQIITIKAHFEEGYEMMYDGIYFCRKDTPKEIIRLNGSRGKKEIPFHNEKRRAGSITIDNLLFGRYAGEIQIVKKDMGRDARVNVIGFIHPEYIEILDYIKVDQKIQFIRL